MIKEYEPFDNAEQVWFWFCGCLIAQEDGCLRARQNYTGKIRKCEVSDIYRIIKILHQNHQISNRQLRVMMKWGQAETSPYYDYRAKRSEIRLWDDGIKKLETTLVSKGIL